MYTWIWILIPLAGILAGIIHKGMAIKERQMTAVRDQAAETVERYASQTERLEQRVRVLERIITDKGIDVSDEIERLRNHSDAGRR
jgi:uncharacterized protein YicC (UPF0701 family)